MKAARAALLGTLTLLAACATTPAAVAPSALPQAQDAYFKAGAARAASLPKNGRAKNYIVFIGDGMGIATITAARIMAGQLRGLDGESYQLAMDTLPHTALSHTYSHDFQVADSAATATAITAGVKTRSGVINVTSGLPRGKCENVDAYRAKSLFEMAEDAGLATGVVSTARITHATPAAVYAHTPHRDWENDAVTAKAGASACPDIARQLIEWPHGDGLEVALGGGRANFLPETADDPERGKGARKDGRNLTAEWTAKSSTHRYIWNAAEFAAINWKSDAKVLGLFSPSHMAYEVERAGDKGGEPSLADMTAAAIDRLSQDKDGYVLMIEGGRVDHAHHEGKAGKALRDAVALDDAVRVALSKTNRNDTLIVVTADHSHTLTFAGYAPRNNPILGLAGSDEDGPATGDDGKPYTTLGYANGPGAVFGKSGAVERPDLSKVDVLDPDFKQQALVPLGSETHGGEDVAIFASGPGSAAFTGSLEQNVIFHNAARALELQR